MSGLSLEIRDRIELIPYIDWNDLVQLCIKVKQQNMRKWSSNKESSYSGFYSKKESKREGGFSKEKYKEEPKKNLAKKKERESEGCAYLTHSQ